MFFFFCLKTCMCTMMASSYSFSPKIFPVCKETELGVNLLSQKENTAISEYFSFGDYESLIVLWDETRRFFCCILAPPLLVTSKNGSKPWSLVTPQHLIMLRLYNAYMSLISSASRKRVEFAFLQVPHLFLTLALSRMSLMVITSWHTNNWHVIHFKIIYKLVLLLFKVWQNTCIFHLNHS